MKTSELKPNPNNPRIISDEKLEMLAKALTEFGDLSGIVYNRTTEQLIGGHQRVKILDNHDCTIDITKKYTKPTRTGTVAEGYVNTPFGRFSFREVEWNEYKERAANIAANRGAGEWDTLKLGEWMRDLDDIGFNVDLTMFDLDERIKFMGDKGDPWGATTDTESASSDGDLHRIVLVFGVEEYRSIVADAESVMARLGINDMSQLFVHLLSEHATA